MKADTNQIDTFLRALFDRAISREVRGFIGCSAKDATGRWSAATFPVVETTAAATWLAALNDAGHDVYVRQTVLAARPSSGRGTARSTGWLVGLWADIDIAGPGHMATNLPADIAEAVKIADLLAPATIIVNSGGGIYSHWLLREPLDVRSRRAQQDAEALTRSWCTELARVSDRHVDQVGDLARVLRPPGSVSLKRSPTRVKIHRPMRLEDHSHTPESLRAAVAPTVVAEHRTVGPPASPSTAGNTYGPWDALNDVGDLADVLAEDGVFGPWHETRRDVHVLAVRG